MTTLEADHPEVYQSFMEEQFSVQLAGDNPFGRLPVDQTTEVTVNKDTKIAGGVTKFSLKTEAVNRFYLTAEFRSAFLGQLRDMVQVRRLSFHHDEMQTPRFIKDEVNVKAVENLLQSWNNPFAESQNLVSISTAKGAPDDVKNDLMSDLKIGEEAYQRFKKERLESNPPKKKFHDPIQMKKLKTFSSLCKKKEINSKGRAVILKADRSLFGRMIVMGQSRKIHMKDLLSHSLGPLPWALAMPEGFPRKTNKASIAAFLQKNVQVADAFLPNSATVIDDMSLVQKLNVGSSQTTFENVAKSLLTMALKEGEQSTRIDIVFDTYRELSTKNAERSIRGEDQGIRVQKISAQQVIKQWRQFLHQLMNKTSLIKFLVSEWRKPQYLERLLRLGKSLFVTCEDKCWKLSGECCEEIPELCSCHKEADGRLLLHATHAAQEGYEAVIISSENTDVFILLLAFDSSINSRLFQKCGNQTRTKLVDIGKIASTLGDHVCKGLIGLHAYTGCDTVSAFAGKGKVNSAKILKSDKCIQDASAQLGQNWTLSEDLFDEMEKFTCALYTPGASTGNINDARYNLFCAKNGEIESHQLPPCQDCLRKHAVRANYQAGIWRRSLERNPSIPSPNGNGWKLETTNDKQDLVIDWMEGKPAPEAVLELLACKCARSCKLPQCVCLLNGLKCTDLCKLKDCDNQPQELDEVEQEEEDNYE